MTSENDWFHFDYIHFLPLWVGIWRWAAYLILKAIPSLIYKPIPISDDLEPGHVPVSTQMMTLIVPVYMPEPGFEECLQSWVDNRPKTVVVVVDTNSYQQVSYRFKMQWRKSPLRPEMFWSSYRGTVRSTFGGLSSTLKHCHEEATFA